MRDSRRHATFAGVALGITIAVAVAAAFHAYRAPANVVVLLSALAMCR